MGLAEGVPVRFEAVAPVRAFPSFKRQRYFPGLWWSATTRRQVGYESWLERDHLMLLDHDPAVVGIASQPFWQVWTGMTWDHRRWNSTGRIAIGSPTCCAPSSSRPNGSTLRGVV